MAWTETTRRNYVRRTSGYASDVTDREWDFVAPFMPAPRRLGRPRKTDLRDVLNALLYIASTGCQWRMLPKDFRPCSTVQRYFYEWRAMGLWPRINLHLVMEARELEGEEASPTAGAIDGQSVKTTESGGIRGFDAGKKIKGRKRHIIVDTLGLMVGLMVHSADIQDRDGAPDLLKSIKNRWPCCFMSSLMAAMRATSSKSGCRKSGNGHSKSSNVPTRPKVLKSCRAAGSSSGPSPGWVDAADWPRTSKNPSLQQKRGSPSPTSACSPDALQDMDIVETFFESDS